MEIGSRQPEVKWDDPIAVIGWTDEAGAGEGIRTLDPNLGKVVLYP